MTNCGICPVLFLGTTFLLFLTFWGTEATARVRVSSSHVRREQSGIESMYQSSASSTAVYHHGMQTGMRTVTVRPKIRRNFKMNKVENGNTRSRTQQGKISVDVTGPNVCGSRCCHGWTVHPKTRKCTKPRCYPRCHNRAVCRRPNTCECRAGFHGYRCELELELDLSSATSDPHATPTQVAPTATALERPSNPTTPAMPSSTTTATATVSSTAPSLASQTTHAGQPQGALAPGGQLQGALEEGQTGKPEGALEEGQGGHLGALEQGQGGHLGALEQSQTGQLEGAMEEEGQLQQLASDQLAPAGVRVGRQESALQWIPYAPQEDQSVELRKTLSSVVKGRKIVSLLMKHIQAERNKLLSSPPDTHKKHTHTSSTKTFHTERGQYTLVYSYVPDEDPHWRPKTRLPRNSTTLRRMEGCDQKCCQSRQQKRGIGSIHHKLSRAIYNSQRVESSLEQAASVLMNNLCLHSQRGAFKELINA